MAKIVLCVDDDPDDRDLIRNAIFHVDPSYTVAHATNGKEALQYLQRASETELPCLVILDINMPVMDGKQTLVEIKRQKSLVTFRSLCSVPPAILPIFISVNNMGLNWSPSLLISNKSLLRQNDCFSIAQNKGLA